MYYIVKKWKSQVRKNKKILKNRLLFKKSFIQYSMKKKNVKK